MNLNQETINTATATSLVTGSGIGIVAYLESHLGLYTVMFMGGNLFIAVALGAVTIRSKLAETALHKQRTSHEQTAFDQKQGIFADKIKGTDNAD